MLWIPLSFLLLCFFFAISWTQRPVTDSTVWVFVSPALPPSKFIFSKGSLPMTSPLGANQSRTYDSKTHSGPITAKDGKFAELDEVIMPLFVLAVVLLDLQVCLAWPLNWSRLIRLARAGLVCRVNTVTSQYYLQQLRPFLKKRTTGYYKYNITKKLCKSAGSKQVNQTSYNNYWEGL